MPGEPGRPGADGAPGPAGPPGDIARLDWPFIEKTNWPQGRLLDGGEAVALLRQVQLTLSAPLHSRTQEQQPQVVQVWFEPGLIDTSTQPAAPLPLLTLHGDQKLAPRQITWACSDNPDRTVGVIANGGRMMLRVHCGHLMAEDERAFSSSLDGLLGTRSPHIPAGVFEGWFFVANPRTVRPGPTVAPLVAKLTRVRRQAGRDG